MDNILTKTDPNELIEILSRCSFGDVLNGIRKGKIRSWRHDLFISGSCKKYPQLKKSDLQDIMYNIGGFTPDQLLKLSMWIHNICLTDQDQDIGYCQTYLYRVLLKPCLKLLVTILCEVTPEEAKDYLAGDINIKNTPLPTTDSTEDDHILQKNRESL